MRAGERLYTSTSPQQLYTSTSPRATLHLNFAQLPNHHHRLPPLGVPLNLGRASRFVLTGSQVVYFDSHKDAAAGRSPKCVVKLTDISEVGEVTEVGVDRVVAAVLRADRHGR